MLQCRRSGKKVHLHEQGTSQRWRRGTWWDQGQAAATATIQLPSAKLPTEERKGFRELHRWERSSIASQLHPTPTTMRAIGRSETRRTMAPRSPPHRQVQTKLHSWSSIKTTSPSAHQLPESTHTHTHTPTSFFGFFPFETHPPQAPELKISRTITSSQLCFWADFQAKDLI